LLDLFCGAGGSAVGYHRAGFDVVGVDIESQPHYPFEFIQGDALEALERLQSGPWCGWAPSDFDAVHASPPCQDHSVSTVQHASHATGWMLDATLDLLKASGLPWVCENVVGKSVKMDGWWAMFCGTAFGLNSQRHRRIGSSVMLMPPSCRHRDFPYPLSVVGDNEQGRTFRKWRADLGRTPNIEDKKLALGIDWMNRKELSQAIPPAFTEFVGRQLLAHLQATRV
jgi:DNA (cytosine-5)-methyltransferase 1